MEDTKTIISRVTKYGRKPTTVYQALRQAHDLLAEEGSWCTGELFQDGDAQEAYEKSACGDWQACAMGAIALVAGELPISVTKEWYPVPEEDLRSDWSADVGEGITDLSFKEWVGNLDLEDDADYWWNSVEFDECDNSSLTVRSGATLARAIMIQEDHEDRDEAFDDKDLLSVVYRYNDDGTTSRTKVLDAFKVAMNLARKKS